MTIPSSGSMMVDGGPSCLPLTPEEENRIFTELIRQSESNLKDGNFYYVISNRWFTRWTEYVGLCTKEYSMDEQSSDTQAFGLCTKEYSMDEQSSDTQALDIIPSKLADRPGPIDNSDIILDRKIFGSNDLELRKMLEEGLDYVLVPQSVWQKLLDWYTGGPALQRKLIAQGVDKNFDVEVYPLCLNLIDFRDDSESIIRLSKKATVGELLENVCTLKGIEKEKMSLWDYFNKQKQSVLDCSSQTLEESNLQMDQDVLLEVKFEGCSSENSMDSTLNEFALVAIEPSRSPLSIAGGPIMSNGHSTGNSLYQGHSIGSSGIETDDLTNHEIKKEKGGLAGLQNLGNTCFMNSAIQCLVHSPPVVEYFLQDYSEEINVENPLGMRGELALAFGELLRKLWSPGRTAIAPRVFKGKLARFAPQFSGYNQHDSQELLAFLLDGLHEDLNRVKQKPYFEMKDSDGRADEEIADECWRYHKARNDSLIVDVCQGQYKSTLVCPECGKISITFDPFMYLSLPLPSTLTRSITVTIFYGDGSGLPISYTVTVPKHGSCKDLSTALGAACCLKNDEILLLAEIYDHRVYQYFENPFEQLTSIKDEECIVAYRFFERDVGRLKLEIIQRCQDKSSSDRLKGIERKLFGTPLVTFLGEEQQGAADINAIVSKILSPMRRTYSTNKMLSSKENGVVSEMVIEPLTSCNGQTEPMDQSTDENHIEFTSDDKLPFQLILTDERALGGKPIVKDSLVKPDKLVKVFLDWTQKEHELYDARYLKDLPVVYRTRFVKKTLEEAISLFSCLEAFLKEEPLGPHDMWYCPRCKEHRQASKKLDLWKLPEIIVFHLKRFSFSRYHKTKLDTFVDFPIHNLDLSKYVKSRDGTSHVYDLYAISNHYGGLGGGHYTAYAKLIDDENRWYHFDDSHVSVVGESDIKTSAAYLLFYQRTSKTRPCTGETSLSNGR